MSENRINALNFLRFIEFCNSLTSPVMNRPVKILLDLLGKVKFSSRHNLHQLENENQIQLVTESNQLNLFFCAKFVGRSVEKRHLLSGSISLR